ncbi:hypothetical protein M9979_07220 [Sphingomonas sp. RP10(2022)]|uniref:Uncharacterized protein n=1 Tax=Sphingomonas liriopis TaxID=2949094 RepID=A0A9X2HXL2_9SPHN|nr:hypothetical protein [Sphingomonas liriopis]MCP3734660.1 hypothetical protein [Sphingomonas liriopis]
MDGFVSAVAMVRRSGASVLFGVVAAVLFVASLALPVATAQQTQGLTTITGLNLLLIGPLGALNGQFGWFATPCLAVAIYATVTRRPCLSGRGRVIVILAMGIALIDALFWTDYPNDGGPGPIVSFGTGYYLWIAAVVVGALGLMTTLGRDQSPRRRR